jgi:hypothetical protein
MRAFGRHHDAEPRALAVAVADALGHLLRVVGDLRNQDGVGAAGHAGVQRNPPGVAPHHLDHHHAVMRLGGRVQAVDGVGGKAHRGVEAEAARRADDVVVDRLRHADERDAHLVELVRDGQRTVAADADERVELHRLEHLEHAVGVVEGSVGVTIGCANGLPAVHRPEDRAAETQDAGDVLRASAAAPCRCR